MKGFVLIVEELSVDKSGEKAEKLAVDKKLTRFEWTLNSERRRMAPTVDSTFSSLTLFDVCLPSALLSVTGSSFFFPSQGMNGTTDWICEVEGAPCLFHARKKQE